MRAAKATIKDAAQAATHAGKKAALDKQKEMKEKRAAEKKERSRKKQGNGGRK